jgi:hypothetical protein
VQQEVSQPAHHCLAAWDNVPRGMPRHKALHGSEDGHTRQTTAWIRYRSERLGWQSLAAAARAGRAGRLVRPAWGRSTLPAPCFPGR